MLKNKKTKTCLSSETQQFKHVWSREMNLCTSPCWPCEPPTPAALVPGYRRCCRRWFQLPPLSARSVWPRLSGPGSERRRWLVVLLEKAFLRAFPAVSENHPQSIFPSVSWSEWGSAGSAGSGCDASQDEAGGCLGGEVQDLRNDHPDYLHADTSKSPPIQKRGKAVLKSRERSPGRLCSDTD